MVTRRRGDRREAGWQTSHSAAVIFVLESLQKPVSEEALADRTDEEFLQRESNDTPSRKP